MIGVDGVESEDEHDWQRRTGARKQMEYRGLVGGVSNSCVKTYYAL